MKGSICMPPKPKFTREEIIEMLGHDFVAMLVHIKTGQMNQPTIHPVQKTEE